MDLHALRRLLRTQQYGVVATIGPHGTPEAAVVGLAVDDDGHLLFDTSAHSRKAANLAERPNVAVVVWQGEVTIQAEGRAEILDPTGRVRHLAAYLEAFPSGAERVQDSSVVLVRVSLEWMRVSDFRPQSLAVRVQGQEP